MQLQLIKNAVKFVSSRKEYMHQHYLQNREKYLKRAAEYRKNNPDKIKAYFSTPEKKAKMAAYMREYRKLKAHEEECRKERNRTAANWIREKRAKEKRENINRDNARQKIAEMAKKILAEFS